VDGFSTPNKRSDRVILEANTEYWDPSRFPRLQRIIFDNTLTQKAAVELVKTGEGRVDLVSGLSPLETLRVAQSPFGKVVKNRGALVTLFGYFNIRKPSSPWADVRMRRAVNLAIHRADLIRYAAKGNGVLVPALLALREFGYDPTLSPYAFDPDKARQLFQEAGYPAGLSLILIAPEDLLIQATVVSKMLEQVGLTVDLQLYESTTYNQKIFLSALDQPPEQQPWDIALSPWSDTLNFPVFEPYQWNVFGGPADWVNEQPALYHLYEQVLRTVDREQQERLIRQIERHTHAQAYFLFLYSPIPLYAVNKEVEFVPYVTTVLKFDNTAVTDQHWSVRKQKSAGQE
jgi:peptide/nickel transport system substrate-binding protein